MYHSYYPYLFDHGEKMSLYPKIPSNPREWQPGQLMTTYDAIREDKYDAFVRLRKKFPELYEDTHAWENPPPFGEFNQFYSVRFGMIGIKAFTTTEYDQFGNELKLTAYWFPDNQVIDHKTTEFHGYNAVDVGCTNVPVEFHKPYVTSIYKARRVPVKHVTRRFMITPDAFAPIGTKLDVRHFKPGQEVNIEFQETFYGYLGVMKRYGFDGGPVWLGDKKWQRRPGSIGSEGASRVYPGRRNHGNTGGGVMCAINVPIWRIDYKNQLIYCMCQCRSDIGSYARFTDVLHVLGKTSWNHQRGLPSFPTFVPPENEDIGAMATEDCQLVSNPLVTRTKDDHLPTAMITQAEMDDARQAKPATPPPKKVLYDFKDYLTARKKRQKEQREAWKKDGAERAAELERARDEVRRKKIMARRRVK